MALALRPTISLVFSFRDNDNKSSTMEVLVPGATAPASALTYGLALAPLAAALVDSTLTGFNVVIGYSEAGALVIGSSDVENKGVFLLTAANAIKSMVTIPSPLESILQGNNIDIDYSNADVSDFIDAITLGLSGIQPVNAGGSDITGVYDGYKQNRRSHVNSRQRKG